MEFTVAKSDLARELVYAGGCVETRTTMPHLGTFLLEAEGDTLRITSTDLAVGYTSSIPAQVKTPGKTAVNAKMFDSYVSRLQDGSMQFKLGDNDRLFVTSGRNKTRIATLESRQFPMLPVNGASTLHLPSDVLSDMLNKVIFAMGEEPVKIVVNGILFTASEAGLTLTATNLRTLATVDYVSDLELPEVSFVLAKRGASELRRLLADFSESRQIGIALSENNVSFSWGNRLLTSRLLDGKYPAFKPFDFPNVAVISAETLKGVLERVGGFSNDVSRRVNFSFGDNELTVASKDGSLGDGEETIDLEYKGEPKTIGLNAIWPREFLKRASDHNVVLKFSDSFTEWYVEGDPSYRYYLSLMV